MFTAYTVNIHGATVASSLTANDTDTDYRSLFTSVTIAEYHILRDLLAFLISYFCTAVSGYFAQNLAKRQQGNKLTTFWEHSGIHPNPDQLGNLDSNAGLLSVEATKIQGCS